MIRSKLPAYLLLLLGGLSTHTMAADLFISAGNGGGGSQSNTTAAEKGLGGSGNITNKGGDGGDSWGQYASGGGGGSASYVSTSNQGATSTGNGANGGNSSGGGCGSAGAAGTSTYSPLAELGNVTTQNGTAGQGGGGISTSHVNNGGDGGHVTVEGGHLTQYNNISIASGFNGTDGTKGSNNGKGGKAGNTVVILDSLSNVDTLTLYKNDGDLTFNTQALSISNRTTTLDFQGGATAHLGNITLGDKGILKSGASLYTYDSIAITGNHASLDSLTLSAGKTLSFDLSKATLGDAMLFVGDATYEAGAQIVLNNALDLQLKIGSQVTLIQNSDQTGLSNLTQQTLATYRDFIVYQTATTESNSYVLKALSAWNSGGAALGTGTFTTHQADGPVTISDNLSDQTGTTYASGWDGKSFHKKGNGNLTLNGMANYTGSTIVEADGSINYYNTVSLSGSYTNKGTVFFNEETSLSGEVKNSGFIQIKGANLSIRSLEITANDTEPDLIPQVVAADGASITITDTVKTTVTDMYFDETSFTFDLSDYFSTQGNGTITLAAGSEYKVLFDTSFYTILAEYDTGKNITLILAKNDIEANMFWENSTVNFSDFESEGWQVKNEWAQKGQLVFEKVPEPSTTTLGLLGLTALLVRRRRQA